MGCIMLLGVEASFMEGHILVFIIPLIQGNGSAVEFFFSLERLFFFS
jgi:hypothetical protein